MKYVKYIILCLFTNIFMSSPVLSQSKNNYNKNHAEADLSELNNLRSKIDSLDKEIITSIGKRQEVVRQVGEFKKQKNISALQKGRYNAIVQKNIDLGKEKGLSKEFILNLMEAIHKESLKIENNIIKNQ